MGEIQLTRGQITLVDDEDYDYLTQWKWCALYNTSTKTYYVVRNQTHGEYESYDTRKMFLMHRVILQVDNSYQVDHVNHNTLDNRKENLRLATISENLRNRNKPKNNKSGYKGVSWKSRDKVWAAQIKIGGKSIYLGSYTTPEDAYDAYKKAAIELHGEFAKLE